VSDLALFDQVKGDSSAQIIGAKLFSYQSLSTSLSAGNLLQLEINYEANKSMQVWVKSSDDQYVLIGNITFDKDGNAVLPGIEFKKSGQYELIFVNSDKNDLNQPELVNKVSGLTVYVN
jgi:ribosomal protein L27